ncbi:MAG: HAMP domain-containing histidine kinase, partial [Oscillospiraceae bacterium]|nr:HAMP domain-containing histidine kinase [Oscillospiraceae bacterium]
GVVPQSVLGRLSADLNSLTAFFAEDKTLLYSELPPQASFAVLDGVSDSAHVYQFQAVDGVSYIMVCGKLNIGDEALYLLVASDISDVVAQKELMAQSFTRVYGIALLLGLAVISALSAFISGPITKMNKAAAGIARGRYSERLPVAGGDEISELSQSFNMMADAVEDRINELYENARQKEDFVASFAHELKTPLTSVIGYADMLYQKTFTADKVKEAAWYILSEGLRLEALSLKLMDLIVLDRQEFSLEAFYADELLSGIAGGLAPLFGDKRVTLQLNTQPARVIVEYDLFKTLLLNLIDNSMKAGCSSIEVVGKPIGDHYDIYVTDNGCGIPTAELKRITEAFYVVDKSRSRRQHGAGLGLSLAAKIAEIHGAPLDISSSEGVGTTVTIALRLGSGE